jgi:polysaccharide biosynthesis/export protein
MRSALCAAAVIIAGLVLTGCRTADTNGAEKMLSIPDARVILAPGDLVDVKFFYTPELNESQRIRPDGKITLQLAGEVMAAGLTPSQLQSDLEKKYASLIEKPSVAVIARTLNHRNVYIGGAVNRPGMIEMPGDLTALSAILKAGGFNLNEAALENVLVIRQEGETQKAFCLDFREDLEGGAPQAPFYLHAQDIVYVPRTRIVDVNQWISQHINKVVPQFGFTFFHVTGDNTIGLDTSNSR